MRILLINHRYFIASGAERYLFNVQNALEQLGHQVAPFAIAYKQNQPTPWSGYFTSPIGTEDQIYFDQHRRRPKTYTKAAGRLVHSFEVQRDLERLIDDFNPDIAYVLLFKRKLSPSIFSALKATNVPTVVRVSDYGFLCPANTFLRDGVVCTKCHTGKLWPAVMHGCVHESRAVSLAEVLATAFHRANGYFDHISRFVATNEFLLKTMVEGGFPASRLTCVPTFVDQSRFHYDLNIIPNYLLYAGRLDPSKGLPTLIEAMAHIAQRRHQQIPPLLIAGSPQYLEYQRRLEAQVSSAGLAGHVRFLGSIPPEGMPQMYRGAIATIIPSLWYENLPNTYLESMASGAPIIASRIGSLESAIEHQRDGLLFDPGSASDLSNQIERIIDFPEQRSSICQAAKLKLATHYSADKHVQALDLLFSDVIAEHAHDQIRNLRA